MAQGDRLLQGVAQVHGGRGFQHPIGFSHEANAQRQSLDRLQTALQDRARGMVTAHAIHGHPEPGAVIDHRIVAAAATLQSP
jgi:hypothetical protein